MLELRITGEEGYNETTEEFVSEELAVLRLEHSLASLSKWESKFEKPFLGNGEKTEEETLWYIRAMCLDDNVDPDLFKRIDAGHAEQINQYINSGMTATWFAETKNQPTNKEVVTAEIIYNWMIALNLPFECQFWHLNRLITLVKVVNQKNAPAKKMSKSEIHRKNRELNAQRRAQYGTRG